MMAERKGNILRRRPLVAFFVLSILLFVPLFAAAGVAFTLEAPSWLQYLTQALSSWSPNLAAVIVTAAIGGSAGVRELLSGFLKWRVRLVWYLIAIVVPIALGFAVARIYYLLASRPAGVLSSFTLTTFLGTVLNHLFRGLARFCATPAASALQRAEIEPHPGLCRRGVARPHVFHPGPFGDSTTRVHHIICGGLDVLYGRHDLAVQPHRKQPAVGDLDAPEL
jgi:hypothetical protein